MQHKKLLSRFIPVHTGNIVFNVTCSIFNPVYPCAYREHSCASSNFFSVSGLSLCIQGTFVMFIFFSVSVRFIPVHTGNIKLDGKKRKRLSVYPCAYREHQWCLSIYRYFGGLSLCIQGTFHN